MTIPLFMIPLEIPVTLDGQETVLVFRRPTPEQSFRASALRWEIAQAATGIEGALDRGLAMNKYETEHGIEYVEMMKECLIGVKSPAGEFWPGALEAVKESDLLTLVRAEVCARLFFRFEDLPGPSEEGLGGSEGGVGGAESEQAPPIQGLRDAEGSGDV